MSSPPDAPAPPAAMTAEDARELQRFPPALRALIDDELAAGNAVVEVGGGFPAPPAGALVKLARQVTTRPRESGGGLAFRARDSSTCSGEWTDSDGFFFALEPPSTAGPAPDMDAIRARASPPAPPSGAPAPPPFTVEVDPRGEMLIYREADRRATVVCTFTGDPRIAPRTLDGWWHPAERRTSPMTPEEARVLIDRIADHCRRHLGMPRLTVEKD
ncbi:MAG: hypothetical protein IPK81_18915 [Rhodospirillales bacterium]|nr:MAG: hypothetical protein IPK81_18915 [Rhodospirillales bacterium]